MSGLLPSARMNAALLAAGQIALTVTPYGAHSLAAVRVRAQVGRLLQCGCCAGNQHQIQTRLREQPGEFSAHPLRAARDQRPRPVLRGVDHRVDARTPAYVVV
jgi:hypothetical protein